MFRLPEAGILVGFRQFIERTETGGGGQQIAVGRFKDNPR
jgi:hypothetical protein